MIGSIRWNFYLGAAAGVVTFLSSFSNNILTTSLMRSLYSFLLLFVVMFAFRWFIGMMIEWNKGNLSVPVEDNAGKGQSIDLITPDDESSPNSSMPENGSDEDSLNEIEEPGDFSPLDPPKLITKKEASAEEMAKALRHLSEK